MSKQKLSKQRGVSLIEALASMSLFALVGLGLTGNTIYALKINKFTEVNNTIHNIAMSKIEEFAAVDASTLDDSDDSTESSVTTPGSNFTFRRVSNITVNAGGTRSIAVTVSCNDPRYASTKTYNATFAVWE